MGDNLEGFRTFVQDGDVIRADDSSSIGYRERNSLQGQASIQLVLISTALLVFKKKGDCICSLQLVSILGASSSGLEMTVSQYEDTRHSGKGCFSCGGPSDRKRRKHVFTFPSAELCAEWTDQVNASLGIERRKFLVLLNPVSGQRRSQSLYDNIVRPMLEEAHIDPTLLVTERQNHAYDLMSDSSYTLDHFNVVMVVGGDGLLYEVINGLARRASHGVQLLQQMPIAPIPGGSGNGLAKSILFESDDEYYSVQSATFVAIKGVPSPLDLSVVNTKSDSMYSFLSMSWGLVSDVDIGSEPLRCLGEARLHLAAVYYIACRRSYPGRLLMHLADEESEDRGDEQLEKDGQQSVADNSGMGDEEAGVDAISIFQEDDFLAQTPPKNLKVIEGRFQLVWALQTPYLASTIYAGPGVALDDGLLTILVVQDMSAVQLLKLMIDIDSGDHVKSPGVQVYKAHAYRLEPYAKLRAGKEEDDDEYRGIIAVDGESIDAPHVGPCQSKILPKAARVLKLPSSGITATR